MLDIEEMTKSQHKILKPKGEAGKSNSEGYNLQVAMGWEDEEFAKFTVSQASCSKKSPNYLLNRNTSMMKLERNLISRFVTVNRSMKTWMKSFNQYEFKPHFKYFSYYIIQMVKQFKIQDRYYND